MVIVHGSESKDILKLSIRANLAVDVLHNIKYNMLYMPVCFDYCLDNLPFLSSCSHLCLPHLADSFVQNNIQVMAYKNLKMLLH